VLYLTHKTFQGIFSLVFTRSFPTQKVQIEGLVQKIHPSIEGPIQKNHPPIEGPLQKIHPSIEGPLW
jgi:type IV secretory pathway VirB2 component (pilin)